MRRLLEVKFITVSDLMFCLSSKVKKLSLEKNGFAKKIVQYNGTIVLFQLINRILSDDKGLDADFTFFF